MTTKRALLWLAGVFVYSFIGFLVVYVGVQNEFILEPHWYHVVFWPVVVAGWLVVLAVLWGLSN